MFTMTIYYCCIFRCKKADLLYRATNRFKQYTCLIYDSLLSIKYGHIKIIFTLKVLLYDANDILF